MGDPGINKIKPSIVTIGFSPAWDITCYGKNLEWGTHKNIDKQTIIPAGKALNISKALAWMRRRSVAAGLWGDGDYQQMQKEVESLWPLITVKMTVVAGQTRRNITIVDAENKLEMHLRSKSELAHPKAMERLNADLKDFVNENSICVFSGAIPQNKISDAIRIMRTCHKAGGKIVLDTSGPALKEIIATGLIWLTKPNVFELEEMLGEQINDSSADLVEAGRKLLEKTEIILISRGKNGAVVVGRKAALKGRCKKREEVLSTVGCGDYLLAGFLSAIEDMSELDFALETALKAASVKAWGLTENIKWQQIETDIKVDITKVE